MKTRGAYKKRPGSNGMPHFNRERSRPRIDEDFLAMERMTRQGAHIYWGSETRADGSSPSKFVRDKTWGLTFQHFSQVDTDFSIKAGSKKMLLTSAPIMSSADPSKVVKISESWLHKKYRWYIFFVPGFFAGTLNYSEVVLSNNFFIFSSSFSATCTQSMATSFASVHKIAQEVILPSRPQDYLTFRRPTLSLDKIQKKPFSEFLRQSRLWLPTGTENSRIHPRYEQNNYLVQLSEICWNVMGLSQLFFCI